MKILFYASPGFDYLSNQLMEGLWFNYKNSSESTLHVTNKCVHHGCMIDDLPVISDEQAREWIDEYDIIILNSAGDFSFKHGHRGQLLNDSKYKDRLVFVDGHDGNGYLCDPRSVKMYVKRELRYPEACAMVYNNVRSLTFGVYEFLYAADRPPGYDDREYDIAFIAYGGSNTLRAECHRVLDSKAIKDRFKVYVNVSYNDQPVGMEEYRHIMRNTKIGVSIIGAGYDTLRFWETMAHGAVLCSNDITRAMVIRNMPEPNRHALYFDSWNRMINLCDMVVRDKDRWESMRRATDKLLYQHSTYQRAIDFIRMFQEL